MPTILDSYCLFCRTGSEKALVQAIQQSFPDVTALAPVKLLPEKRQKVWTNREVVLLPGYVFVYVAGELPGELRHKVRDLYKILQYEYGERKLCDNDAAYAEWVYRHSGSFAPSRVLTVGGSVQVSDGPLKDCIGSIVKLDKHKRRAWVEFTFDGQKRIVSMGAEWIADDQSIIPTEVDQSIILSQAAGTTPELDMPEPTETREIPETEETQKNSEIQKTT